MVNSLFRATSQTSLNRLVPPPHRRDGTVGNSFRVSTLTAPAPVPDVSAAPSSNAASTASQILGTSTTAGQNSVTSTPQQAATPKLTGDAAILQALKDALAAAGINADGLGLATHQDVVTYPGGAYINRYISVETNGHEEGLMTDLVGINPNVAVLDIKHMLGRA